MRLSVWLVLFSMLALPAAGAGEARRAAGAVAFSGRVVDAHGRPAPGALVYVSLSIEAVPGADPPPRPVSQTRSAAGGAFRLTVPVPERKWSAAVVAVAAGQGPGGQDVRSAAEAAGLLIRLTHPSFLAGTVVDRSGQPIAGAKVNVAYTYRMDGEFLYLPPEEARPQVVTDAEGRFRLAPLTANSRLVVNVDHPDYPPLSSMRMPFASGRDDLTIALPPASTVVGCVVSEDRRPAARVTVRCEGWGQTVPPETTDAEGRFRFTRLREDHYLFRAELPGDPPEYVTDPQGVVPPEGGEARCPDLRLIRGGILTGKLIDERGRPIAGMTIYSRRTFYFSQTNTQGGAEGPSARSGKDGGYRLRLPPGKWRVSPGYFGSEYTSDIPWDEWPSQEVAEGATLHHDFTLQKALAVRGRILDAAGRPAPDAKVERGNWVMRRADAAGRFTLGPQLPPRQPSELTFFSRDGSQGAVLELTPAKLKGELVVRLQRLPAVIGTVTDKGGHPLDGAWVNAERLVPAGGGMSGNRPEGIAAATAGASGRFVLPLFPGNRYRISVQAEGFGTADQFPIIPTGPGRKSPPLRFGLERADAVIAGVVVDPEDKPLPGAAVGVGRTGSTNVYVLSEDAVSDTQGRFRLAHLPPGTVSIHAHRAGYNPDFHPRVPVGTTNVRLVLPPREEATTPAAGPRVGEPAPEIRIARWVNGEGPASLAALRGKTVLLQFSSAYNRAARASNEALKALAARLKASGRQAVVILALYDRSAADDEAEAYARSEALPFPIGLVEATREHGLDSVAFRAYGVRQLPALFLIDGEGILRAVNPGSETLQRLAQ